MWIKNHDGTQLINVGMASVVAVQHDPVIDKYLLLVKLSDNVSNPAVLLCSRKKKEDIDELFDLMCRRLYADDGFMQEGK